MVRQRRQVWCNSKHKVYLYNTFTDVHIHTGTCTHTHTHTHTHTTHKTYTRRDKFQNTTLQYIVSQRHFYTHSFTAQWSWTTIKHSWLCHATQTLNILYHLSYPVGNEVYINSNKEWVHMHAYRKRTQDSRVFCPKNYGVQNRQKHHMTLFTM